MQKLTYKEISNLTNLNKNTICNYAKKTNLTGERLLNYIQTNVIGELKQDENKPFMLEEKLKTLELKGNEPKTLCNNIAMYNQVIEKLNNLELNNILFIKYTTQLLSIEKRISEQAESLGYFDTAIED